MNRTSVTIDPEQFPASLREFLSGAAVYDSSCSPEARVWFLDREDGYYLKTSARGTLEKEAKLMDYFHGKGLSGQVLSYQQADADWLLTRRIPGEDCVYRRYLDDPKRLCDTTGKLLRMLHETDPAGCPVPDRTADYLATVRENHEKDRFDLSLFPGLFSGMEEAWAVVQEFSGTLKADTLLHGDYCLPNILLDNWQFSGFIDLGTGGVGDRHIDLFWGAWSLFFNLKTDVWCGRFLDAYGRDKIDPELLRAIAAFECFA